MTERAYTVAGIDRMREIIEHSLRPRRRAADGQTYTVGDTFHSNGTVTRAVDPAVVEDRLRTYMLAGVAAEDLETHWKEQRERDAAALGDRS